MTSMNGSTFKVSKSASEKTSICLPAAEAAISINAPARGASAFTYIIYSMRRAHTRERWGDAKIYLRFFALTSGAGLKEAFKASSSS